MGHLAIKTAIWTVCLYVLFKLCRTFLSPKKGFGPDDRSTREKALAGEPYVLVAALVLASLVNIYSYWFVHRLARREIAHSTECYGRVGAYLSLPAIERRFDITQLNYFLHDARGTAFEHANWIGLDTASVDKMLKDRKTEFSALYSQFTRRHDTAGIDQQMIEINRCITDQWAPHGEIFNP